MMARTALALRHVAFEDLGAFAAVLSAAGFETRYCEIGVHEIGGLDPVAPDLVVVLGGPIGVHDAEAYPVLAREIAFLRARLAADRPTFGICLGAQLIAAALGAGVGPMGAKEIGFAPLILTAEGQASVLRHLRDVPVLHWHGDMFDLPPGTRPLARTPGCAHQAFARGRTVMGVQFHPEVDATAGLEPWLIGHAAELAGAGIDPRVLRADAARHGARLRDAGRVMFAAWLDGLEGS